MGANDDRACKLINAFDIGRKAACDAFVECLEDVDHIPAEQIIRETQEIYDKLQVKEYKHLLISVIRFLAADPSEQAIQQYISRVREEQKSMESMVKYQDE